MDALINRGILLTEQSRAQEAVADFARAAMLQPRNVQARWLLANALSAAGDETGSRTEYEQACKLGLEAACR
jgi:Flp pilus assembly protein TadD